MTTLEGMKEHCTRCQCDLEIGQIGLCDGCIDDDDTRCSACDGPNDDGEGWDGLCGDCADMVAEDDEVSAWAKEQRGIDFYEQSDDARADLRIDYIKAQKGI